MARAIVSSSDPIGRGLSVIRACVFSTVAST